MEDGSPILTAFSSDVLVDFITHLSMDDGKRFQWTPRSFFRRDPDSLTTAGAQGTFGLKHNLG